MCATALPAIHHHNLYSFSSCTPNCTSSFHKGYHFKPHNSLQIPKPSQKTLHSSPYSTPLTSHTTKPPALSSVPSKNRRDPELRAVLEIATDSELFDLEKILFGPSYFSPLLKSITNGPELGRYMIVDDLEEREQFIDVLESRFLYLAADARSVLRGWRPTYRNVLLDVREELNIPCSRKLPTEDLELEIFIHIIHKCSSNWDTGAALRVGAAELCSVLLKGGQLISLLKISELVSARFSGKVLLEAAKHKIESKVIEKGVAGATAKALGLHNLASFFGPVLWGAFLADLVIQMFGTDYSRILQAIFAFAQTFMKTMSRMRSILQRGNIHFSEPFISPTQYADFVARATLTLSIMLIKIRILRKHGLYMDRLTTGF